MSSIKSMIGLILNLMESYTRTKLAVLPTVLKVFHLPYTVKVKFEVNTLYDTEYRYLTVCNLY